MRTLAERLAKKRADLGLSQQELARRAKLSQSVIGMLESGARKNSAHIPAIANVLGVESLWLSSGSGPETRHIGMEGLSSHAVKIANLVNKMSEEQQLSLLNFLTTTCAGPADPKPNLIHEGNVR